MSDTSTYSGHNATHVLTLKNICIGFSGVPVLRNASFFLRENEIHAIVGKNGAGKSTFMKILTGVYTPDSGEIVIAGIPQHTSRSTTKERYTHVAMVYQDLSLIPSLTVLQNIFLVHHPGKKYGILWDKKVRDSAQQLLAQVGLSHVSLDQRVEQLSVGESQLVEIAKAISLHPKIIVFDEPTASLSNIETALLFKTIENLRNQGLSVIYITHYLEDVVTLCDRVTVLRNGEIISTSDIARTSIEAIVSDMVGQEQEVKTGLKVRRTDNATDNSTPFLQITDATTDKVGPVNMVAYCGEIIGMAGLLGSGRTEILRMLYGLDALLSGTIYIDGTSVAISSPTRAQKLGIALVPEERRTQGLVLEFDIEENIAIPNLSALCTYHMIDNEKKSVIADTMIEQLQIMTTGRKQVVRYLSGGNQQKVVIAKLLAGTPRILLLDDPTYGVDVHAKSEIMKIIQNFVAQGNIVLFVSSEFGEIADFCDRIYIIRKKTITHELAHTDVDEEMLLQHVQ